VTSGDPVAPDAAACEVVADAELLLLGAALLLALLLALELLLELLPQAARTSAATRLTATAAPYHRDRRFGAPMLLFDGICQNLLRV
jgi:hypothetical protein